jgi:hypothetical protein
VTLGGPDGEKFAAAHRGAAMRKMSARSLADLVLMTEALQLGNGKDEPWLSC